MKNKIKATAIDVVTACRDSGKYIFEISPSDMRDILKRKNWINKLKWKAWAYRKYFKIVGKMRPWDYAYVLRMMRFQLDILAESLERYDNRVDSDIISEEIRAVSSYMDAHLDDDYADRCGYDYNWEFVWRDDGNTIIGDNETEEQAANNRRAVKDAIALEEDEWNKMIDLLRGMRSWWD